MTGGGTVVRKDVPPGALAVSAATQRNLEGYVERRAAKLVRDGGPRRRVPTPGAGES